MIQTIDKISIYHKLCVVCLAGMAICLAVTVCLAVRLKIWEVFGFYKRTGLSGVKKIKHKKERKTVVLKKMRLLLLGAMFLEIMLLGTGASAAENTEKDSAKESVLADICYTNAVRLVDESGQLEDIENEQPRAGYTAYYNDTLEISFVMRGEEGGCELKLYRDGEAVSLPKIEWEEQEDGLFQGTFRIEKDEKEHGTDGAYVFYAGAYTSPLLVLDTICPKVEVSYERIQNEEQPAPSAPETKDFLCYNEPVKMTVTVRDINGRYRELQNALKKAEVTDRAGNSVMGSFQLSVDGIAPAGRTSEEGVSWEFLLSTDANYVIPISYEDMAGNRAVCGEERLMVDTSPPKISFTCEAEPQTSQNAVNYKEHGFWFSDQRLAVKVSAEDAVSGLERVHAVIMDENGERSEWERTPEDGNPEEQMFVIPLRAEDFRGTVEVEVCDRAGNKRKLARGCIVESAVRHEREGSVRIVTKTPPSRTVGDRDYYNTDVRFLMQFSDSWSGIGKFSCTAGNTILKAVDYQKAAGSDFRETPSEGITYEYEEELLLRAERNNENDVEIRAEYTDNAGHIGSAAQIYHIDITKPVITVEYDRSDPVNGRFYDTARTAIVTIRERNFDADDVEFMITGTDGALPEIGEWSASGFGDETEHVCRVNFHEDGDYTFSVAFEDLAGNRADYDRVDEFTIDKTPPHLSVTWDNYESEHDFYYAGSRTAVIDILERNFNEELVRVEILRDGQEAPAAVGWNADVTGNHHRLEVTFVEDGDYSLYISGADEAGHTLEAFGPEWFVIDRTPPGLEIYGVEDESANKGAVAPGVRCYDVNLDVAGISFLLRKYGGETVKPVRAAVDGEGSWEAAWEDFPHHPQADGLYVLEAAVQDLAGNKSEARILFSVNRFGSAYVFDEETQKLAGDGGRYYTSREQDIVLTETNVDTLQYREITCNHDGKLKVLEEGRDYLAVMREGENGWKQYTYTICRENFKEEGVYILTIYSEDRAENVSDNGSKGKRIEFAVDRTPPDILISGVEDGGQYRAGSCVVTLDVQDNLHMESVEALVNGVGRVYTAEELAALNGRISFTIENANHFQSLRVTARDAAGNESATRKLSFLITSNIFVQFFLNRTLFIGMAGALCLLISGILLTLLRVLRFR